MEFNPESLYNTICAIGDPKGKDLKRGFAMSKAKRTPFKSLAVKWHKLITKKIRSCLIPPESLSPRPFLEF